MRFLAAVVAIGIIDLATAAAFPAGGVTALATLGLMMRYLNRRVVVERRRMMATLGATLSDGG